jgi:hypothetical protein
MSTAARLLVDALPELGEHAARFVVDCRWGITTLTYIPRAIELTRRQLVTIVLYRHEEDCGRCNLSPLWRQADPQIRAMVERSYSPLATADPRDRRN